MDSGKPLSKSQALGTIIPRQWQQAITEKHVKEVLVKCVGAPTRQNCAVNVTVPAQCNYLREQYTRTTK